ncbi:MAG: ankyrin repeat domain-containing protein, partial [Terriglobia bacterium]
MNGKVARVAVGWMIGFVVFAGLAAEGAAQTADLRLVEAVQNRDKDAVRSLLAQGVDVNAAQADGATAIAWAAHWEDLETADLLIRAKANVNAANEYGVTPLSLACTNRSAAMVEKLLAAGANPNAAQLAGETPLMTCARTGNPDAVRALLARGANPNAKESKRGQTALMWAIAGKHSAAARLLIERGADVRSRSNTGFTPLLFAAQQGDLDSARALLTAGADVNEASADYGSALVVAAASGSELLGIYLLEKGANPNVADGFGITALHHAVAKGLSLLTGIVYDPAYRVRPSNLPKLVQALLSNGANPNAKVTKGIPSYLMAPDAPPLTLPGATPFFLATVAADVDLMRMLAQAGADISINGRGNTTPLMVAAGAAQDATTGRNEQEQKNALDAVKLLVELGADVNATNDDGQTALHAAAFNGADEIVQFLAGRGAAVDVRDKNGETPWSMAAGIAPVLRYRGLYGTHPSTVALLEKLGATRVT